MSVLYLVWVSSALCPSDVLPTAVQLQSHAALTRHLPVVCHRVLVHIHLYEYVCVCVYVYILYACF